MMMKPERSKALHNFPLPSLKWGRQRYLRCIKPHSNSSVQPPPTSSDSEMEGHLIGRPGSSYGNQCLKVSPGTEDGIETLREKVIFDIQIAADEMKHRILKEPAKPWNLRSRRKAPNGVSNVSPPSKTETKSMRLKGLDEKEKIKFSLSLSREEIEQDFMAITGKKLPRRPTKRPKTLQKQLDAIFPGLWLTEITADSYHVPEDAKR